MYKVFYASGFNILVSRRRSVSHSSPCLSESVRLRAIWSHLSYLHCPLISLPYLQSILSFFLFRATPLQILAAYQPLTRRTRRV
jgi:hypothetical protein